MSKYFVTGDGEIIDTGADHVIYAQRILKKNLGIAMKKLIRVQIYDRFFCFESNQEELTDSQQRALRKLYKNHRCIGYTGRVEQVYYTSPDALCVKSINFKKFASVT